MMARRTTSGATIYGNNDNNNKNPLILMILNVAIIKGGLTGLSITYQECAQ